MVLPLLSYFRPPPDLIHSVVLEIAGAKTSSRGDTTPYDTTSQLATIPNIEKVIQNFDDISIPQDSK